MVFCLSRGRLPEGTKQWEQSQASATPWPATTTELCFVTSVYANENESPDRPPDVSGVNATDAAFYLLSNLQSLTAPGWTLVHYPLPNYKSSITQSRWPKFMGWKHPAIQACRTVFYMDGYVRPGNLTMLREYAEQIHNSSVGFAQPRHKLKGLHKELRRIVEAKKDTQDSINRLKQWFEEQPEYRGFCRLYQNTYFGYNPCSPTFQQATEQFWEHYSLEQDTRRDQPLWCFILDKLNVEPVPIPRSQEYLLFERVFENVGYGGHVYVHSNETT